MSHLLETVRAERDKLLAPLRDRLALLDELERLAHQFEGGEGAGRVEHSSQPADALPAPAPRPRARTGGRLSSGGRNGGKAPARAGANAGSAPSGAGNAPSAGSKRAAVLAYVQQHGEVKAAAVAAAVGLTMAAARQHLKALVASGAIQARGATSLRVYLPTRIADQTERDRPHGRVTGVNGKLPDLKQRVANLIAQDPGALNEDRLAQALNINREDVAVATGELLMDDQVILMPDGTYQPGLTVAA